MWDMTNVRIISKDNREMYEEVERDFLYSPETAIDGHINKESWNVNPFIESPKGLIISLFTDR